MGELAEIVDVGNEDLEVLLELYETPLNLLFVILLVVVLVVFVLAVIPVQRLLVVAEPGSAFGLDASRCRC